MNRRSIILLIWGLALLLAITTLAQGPRIGSDLGQFLPRGEDETSRLLLDTLKDGPGSRLILLDLSGAPQKQLAETAKQLAATLTKTPYFQHILGVERALPEADEALLFRYRYLLNPDQFNEVSLQQALQQRLHELSLGTLIDRARLRNDPTALHRQTLLRLAGQHSPKRYNGVWFSDDQEHAMLLLHSAAPSFDLDRQELAINAIYASLKALNQPQIKLLLSGPPLFAVESRTAIRNGSQQLTLWASLGVALLILLAYRSPAATLLIALPLFSAIVVGAAMVVALFGQLHGISLAFGITLIGITVDYPIHLFSHGGNRQSAKQIWPTLRLGVMTTAVGFSALLFSDFEGLAQMGLFAISGLLVAASVTRWVLPALQTTEHALHPSLSSIIGLILKATQHFNLRWLLPLFLIVSLGYLVQHEDDLWETRLNRLSPIPTAQLEQDRQLRQRLHAAEPGQLLLLQSDSLETLLQHSERLTQQLDKAQQEGMLDNFDTPSRYLPSQKRQLQYRDALPDKTTLTQALNSASIGLPFREGLFQPFIDEVNAAKNLQPLTLERLNDTITGLRLSTLLRQHNDGVNGGWYALITLSGIHDREAITHIATTSGARYIDTSRQASVLVGHYRDEALHLVGLGMIMIILILAFSLRAFNRLIHVALPVFTALAVTTALLTLMGERLSLFHLVSLLLVLGIGLDYGLFFDRCRTAGNGCTRTIGALLICSTTTLLVFGLLALSPLPVLHAIGLTVSLGVLTTLLLTLAGGGTKMGPMV